MATMSQVSSALSYPDRFYVASSYAGFDGLTNSVSSKFHNDVALILYALHQQATIGPCTIPKPRGWNPVDQSKWASWHGLGNMASTEAMRLFVKILEEEDPGWYSRASDFVAELAVDVEINHDPNSEQVTEKSSFFPEVNAIVTENGSSVPEIKVIATVDGSIQSKDDLADLVSFDVYDQWIVLPVSGQRPKPRYEHGAAVIHNKMYIFGGNHNGRYLNDLQVLDLKSWAWSKVEVNAGAELESALFPCAGHSFISWENKLLSLAGHTKDPSETIEVKVFDFHTSTWSTLKTYGKSPLSRGGQSVTLVGTSLIIFGGQDTNRSLLNDVHILDLETFTWDEIDTVGVSPSPRSYHTAAVHEERYLLIFGGGSHATCFNDLHVLDLETMEWSRPRQQGKIPMPRAGHTGATVGGNWFIVGGGDNKSGVSETVVLNMSTFAWSVVTTVQGRAPPASEGLSVVVNSCNGEDILLSFGGYNGRYSNEVNFLKPRHKSTLQPKIVKSSVSESVAAVHNTSVTRDSASGPETGQDGKIREIIADNADSEYLESTTV